MKLRFQRRFVPATLTLVAISIVGCGGSPTTSEASGTEATTEITATEDTGGDESSQPASADEVSPEGVLAECQAVRKVLGGSFNNGFGATLSSDSGIIKADDSVFEASVAAAIAADGMDNALGDAQAVLEGLTRSTVSDAELAGYRETYLEQLNALIPEMEAAKAFYQTVDEAFKAEEPDEAESAVIKESFTRTGAIAETIETIADELEDIDEDIFDYCLDVELDAELGQ